MSEDAITPFLDKLTKTGSTLKAGIMAHASDPSIQGSKVEGSLG